MAASSSRLGYPCFGTRHNAIASSSKQKYPSSRVLLASDPDFGSLATDPEEYIFDLTTPEKQVTPSPPRFRNTRTRAPRPHPMFADPVKDEDIPPDETQRTNVRTEKRAEKACSNRASRTAKSSSSARITEPYAPRSRSSRVKDGTTTGGAKFPFSAEVGSKLPYYTSKDYVPRPTVVYVRTEEEADEAIENLNGPIGFDLEWKVTFLKNGGVREGPAALVQVCDATMILLIQVTSMKKFPANLKALIESSTIPKMGVNIRNDGMKLYRDYGILASNLIELGALACQADARFEAAYGRPIVSLAKVVAFYLRRTLDKGPVRTSNWEAELSREQVSYAANDAHCALMVYKKVMSIALAAKRPLTPAGYTSDLAKELEAPQPRFLAELSVKPSDSTIAPSLTRRRTKAALKTTSGTTSSRARPQHLRAFTLWKDGHGLLDICIRMRNKENPLKEATVITYVVSALEADVSLTFSLAKLKEFVQMESGSWVRHRDCIIKMTGEGRGRD